MKTKIIRANGIVSENIPTKGLEKRKAAKKAAFFWSKINTDIHLFEQSKHYDEDFVLTARMEALRILEQGVLVYPPSLFKEGFDLNMSLESKKIRLGLKTSMIRDMSDEEILFYESGKKAAAEKRQSEWRWRIAQHAEEYQEKGWYPFFVTLTIDPKRFDLEEVWKEGRALRRYIRRLSKIVTDQLGHRPAHKTNTPESEYITYVAVLEHGKSREHHHAHLLIWLREIPEGWKQCPNKYIANPQARNRNRCTPLETYWGEGEYGSKENWVPYSESGLSPATYFRTIGDIWSQYGFATPLKDGETMKLRTVDSAGNYLTKYLQKDYKEWQHKVKATRNLGIRKLKQHIQNVENILPLTWRPHNSNMLTSLSRTHTVPLALVRRLAKQENFYRLYKSKQLDLKNLLKNNTGPFQKMLRSVKDGDRPDRMDSLQYFDWVSKHLPDQEGYFSIDLAEAHLKLGKSFPHKNRTNRTSIPGNNI